MKMYMYIIIAFAIWNLAVFCMFGIDKFRAKEGLWRISEKTLVACSFLLGGVGALLGMLIFRHKTKHSKFRIYIPFFAIYSVFFLVLILQNAEVDNLDIIKMGRVLTKILSAL